MVSGFNNLVCSVDEDNTKTFADFFLVILSWLAYLATICPDIFLGDSPEMVNTAFALGVSHPAGFPAYNLLVKGFTFIPLGSVAFKVNLFSSFAACLTLVLLSMTSVRFLQILFGSEKAEKFLWASLLPAGYLAFCGPFWDNATLAEVYTLHSLLTCVVFWLLFSWRVEKDVRYLFGAALAYGLSAGNHATVAFYLPAILILFFCWNRKNILRNLSMCIVFFLVGLSVYVYLPIRSLPTLKRKQLCTLGKSSLPASGKKSSR